MPGHPQDGSSDDQHDDGEHRHGIRPIVRFSLGERLIVLLVHSLFPRMIGKTAGIMPCHQYPHKPARRSRPRTAPATRANAIRSAANAGAPLAARAFRQYGYKKSVFLKCAGFW